jgi:hypothetical protein
LRSLGQIKNILGLFTIKTVFLFILEKELMISNLSNEHQKVRQLKLDKLDLQLF